MGIRKPSYVIFNGFTFIGKVQPPYATQHRIVNNLDEAVRFDTKDKAKQFAAGLNPSYHYRVYSEDSKLLRKKD